MKLYRVPYRWLPRTFFSNIWWIVTDIRDGVRNVFRWAPVVWFDDDSDWTHLAIIMEYKLRRWSQFEESHGHHVTSKRDAKRMLICADLLRRLQADEYFENAVKYFGETVQATKASQRHQSSDQRYLGLILGKYLNHWWN